MACMDLEEDLMRATCDQCGPGTRAKASTGSAASSGNTPTPNPKENTVAALGSIKGKILVQIADREPVEVGTIEIPLVPRLIAEEALTGASSAELNEFSGYTGRTIRRDFDCCARGEGEGDHQLRDTNMAGDDQ